MPSAFSMQRSVNMAFINNKELDALKTENAELKEKIQTFEVRLSVKDKALSEHQSKLNDITLQPDNAVLEEKIVSLEKQLSTKNKALSESKKMIKDLSVEVEELKTKLANMLSDEKIKQVCDFYGEEISKLNDAVSKLEEENASLKTRPHNERGAGRKYKATPEQREQILLLSSQGINHNQIARMMTEQTGGKWNKTTIRNIVISARS
jgi:predicted  nucleic acid-binding Zn-ribbon protein